jgi:hypothetical protein
MYIKGVVEILPNRAPTAAITMLATMSFLAPIRSDAMPLGTVTRNWQRLGIAIIRPIC